MIHYQKLLLAALALLLFSACDAIPGTGEDGDAPIHPFAVNDAKGIAINTETHLIWQNDNIGHGTREEAVTRCEALDFAGITDWKLPTSAQSRSFHAGMNAQGDTPRQAFARCTAEVTSDGYVRTKKGAEKYGGEPGDSINFTGGANIRCISKP